MLKNAFDEFDRSVQRAEISMTPLIDMVFLLLIFFAVTTNFTKETGIKVDKVSTKTARILDKELLLISIDKDGNYWWNGKIRQKENIIADVVKEFKSKTDMTIVLIPDKGAIVDPLIQLMDALRARGISKFSIGTRMTKKNGK